MEKFGHYSSTLHVSLFLSPLYASTTISTIADVCTTISANEGLLGIHDILSDKPNLIFLSWVSRKPRS